MNRGGNPFEPRLDYIPEIVVSHIINRSGRVTRFPVSSGHAIHVSLPHQPSVQSWMGCLCLVLAALKATRANRLAALHGWPDRDENPTGQRSVPGGELLCSLNDPDGLPHCIYHLLTKTFSGRITTDAASDSPHKSPNRRAHPGAYRRSYKRPSCCPQSTTCPRSRPAPNPATRIRRMTRVPVFLRYRT